MSADHPTDADRIVTALWAIDATLKELGELLKAAPEPTPVPLQVEDFSVPQAPAPTPPTAPTASQAAAKTDLTAVPPTDALCRCMHQSVTHVDGVGPCTKTGCSCSKFSYMVAPKPTPGSCSGCGCTPAQVKMVPGTIPPLCVTCKATADALKRPGPVPA